MKWFDLDEFKCKGKNCCGGEVHMSGIFLDMLDRARGIAGVPFDVVSGYRCVKHNTEVGSTSTNHTSGKAADIQCTDSATRVRIMTGLLEAGFNRIGIGPSFVHCDVNDGPQAIWLYPTKKEATV